MREFKVGGQDLLGGAPMSGPTAARPTPDDLAIGTMYFDTTLGKLILVNATRTGWVDAMGVAVF